MLHLPDTKKKRPIAPSPVPVWSLATLGHQRWSQSNVTLQATKTWGCRSREAGRAGKLKLRREKKLHKWEESLKVMESVWNSHYFHLSQWSISVATCFEREFARHTSDDHPIAQRCPFTTQALSHWSCFSARSCDLSKRLGSIWSRLYRTWDRINLSFWFREINQSEKPWVMRKKKSQLLAAPRNPDSGSSPLTTADPQGWKLAIFPILQNQCPQSQSNGLFVLYQILNHWRVTGLWWWQELCTLLISKFAFGPPANR